MESWSNSKLADWLRGTPNMSHASSQEWRKWRKKSQSAHPFRYWLSEYCLDRIQNLLRFPWQLVLDAKYYVNNRYVSRAHSLTAHRKDIKPGDWSDVGNRFLPCLFNELVDFVEIEKAWSCVAWDEKAKAKYNSPFYAYGWAVTRTWRSPEAGIAHLQWERELLCEGLGSAPTYQAVAAKEIMSLYSWWKYVYPTRPDPDEVSGWSAVCNQRQSWGDEELDEDEVIFESIEAEAKAIAAGKEASRLAIKRLHEIEAEYQAEDTVMLTRLISIRQSLWV